MSRRPDPERIETARRAAICNRLIGEGELPEWADAWMAAWASVAARDGLQSGAGYWGDAGWSWIAEQREDPPSPPTRLDVPRET